MTMKKYILSFLVLFIPLFTFSQNMEFSADSAYSHIEHLSITIGPRPMGSQMEWDALNWAKGKFADYAADTSYISEFSVGKTSRRTYITRSGIAVGIFKGKTDSAIVVGGHIDSEDFEIPGANDNASGAATAVELARVWSQRTRHYTMIFCAFGGEEKGLLGSKHFVEDFYGIDNVALMISTDMAASEDIIETLFELDEKQAPKWLVRDAFQIAEEEGLDQLMYSTHFHAILTLSENGPGSDHKSFLARGIPAIDFTSGTGESPIHTPQDDMRFIDKTVLQQYGSFVDKLILNYQENGIPNGENSNFVLWNILGMNLFIPLWLVSLFNTLSLLLGISAFVYTWKKRLQLPKDERVRFSGIKIAILALMIIIFAHFGEALIQLIKGYRYPWVGQTTNYAMLTLLWIFFGLWFVLKLSRNWKFNQDPSSHALRTLIILAVYLVPAFFLSSRLAVYPAITLLFFSAAVLINQPHIKTLLILIAPISIYRLFFNEEFSFMMQMGSKSGLRIDTFVKALLFNTVITLLFFVVSIPFIYSLSYGYFSQKWIKSVTDYLRRTASVISICLLITGLSAYLITQPAYTDKIRPVVQVDAEYELPQKSSSLSIVGSEYFKDVIVKNDTLNDFLYGRIHKKEYPAEFEADWIELSNSTLFSQGEKDTINIDWQIMSTKPWILTMLEIWPDSAGIDTAEFNLPYHQSKDKIQLLWYGYFTDTLNLKGYLTVENGTNLLRKLTTKYIEMPVPFEVTSLLANVEYRTTVIYQDTLKSRNNVQE